MKFRHILLSLATVFVLIACDSNWDYDTSPAEGVLILPEIELSQDADNAGDAEFVPDLSDFTVTLTDSRGESVAHWLYGEMPAEISLPAGSYMLTAESHHQEKAVWSNPYYAGSSARIDITEGEAESPATIVCSMASVKVSVIYPDYLIEFIDPESVVRVEANDEGVLEFSPGETRSGYFQVVEGSTSMVATFLGSILGEPFQQVISVYDHIAPGQHIVITFE